MLREDGRWIMYRLDYGKRRVTSDFVVPDSLRPDELATYLDDMLHDPSGCRRIAIKARGAAPRWADGNHGQHPDRAVRGCTARNFRQPRPNESWLSGGAPMSDFAPTPDVQ